MIIFASEQIAASMKKRWIVFTVLLIVALTAFLYIRFFFVFGEGVKSGELNYVVYKGVLFKTYEGKLIQTGIRSKAAGSIQSYEFEFSVENEALARELMLQGGKTLELHYKEYFGALPWRGFTKFIVDSIVTIGPPVRRGVELAVSEAGEESQLVAYVGDTVEQALLDNSIVLSLIHI